MRPLAKGEMIRIIYPTIAINDCGFFMVEHNELAFVLDSMFTYELIVVKAVFSKSGKSAHSTTIQNSTRVVTR